MASTQRSLRYALVEMTKGKVAIPGKKSYRTEAVLVLLCGPSTHAWSGEESL
jgi:hypothetical protein